MNENQAIEAVHNGWRRFAGQQTPRWTEDTVFWAFRASDRRLFPVLYVDGAYHPWKQPGPGGPALDVGDADYVLPLSAATPPLPDQPVFRNPLPVVVMLVMSNKGLIVIRRALKDGYGKLALPGGFHNLGETWQEACCRECEEEVGIALDPSKVSIYDVVTVQDGKINLMFGVYADVVVDPAFRPDSEVLEVLELNEPVDTAFPAHTAIMARYMREIERAS
ncbi:NUDIX domain-containing protein [Rhizobium laguerreae]|uniref:NUDIX domain-containing protein n=1 Tax=Rhizobium laguerreae TaxID=1076926 RepID=UPI001C90DA61|nr:NUDIX domain-containing protein [Rhizobium laguerreae]MBY3151293.1 NUDIX domain-containing protein [Rhizobium laguerreae]